MSKQKIYKNRHFIRNLSVSTFLYVLFALCDIFLTLNGMDGEIAMEGNPVMRRMMIRFGRINGLIIEKAIVFMVAFLLAVVTFKGIDKRSNWVYYLALTPITRRWIKRKRRYWVAFVPIYFVAAAQGLAALSWMYIFWVW